MRILILSSSTGGGHNMRAKAFQAWAQLVPELKLETQVHRPLENSHGLYRFGVSFYNWIQRYAPYLHHVYFNFLEVAGTHRSERGLMGTDVFRQTLEEFRPDVLLSVHGHLNHGFFEFARSVLGKDRVRCVTYCGELHGGYGFSRHWVNPAADLFIGAVSETCEAAARYGMSPEKTKLGGFVLRPLFYDPAPDADSRREHIRKELGFNPDEFILLLSASSRGANNHVAFLESLKKHKLDLQMVVLCGKSTETREQVEFWMKANPTARVRVLPHNTNVAMLLHCVSAVVARPGTGATSEAIICRCPILLNCLGGIMPQEWITVKFCRKHQLAETIHQPSQLAHVVTERIRAPNVSTEIRRRMNTACPPSNPREVLRNVAGSV